MLTAHGIPYGEDTRYTDEVLLTLVEQAKSIVGEELLENHVHIDYVPDFSGSSYVTDYYPLLLTQDETDETDDDGIGGASVEDEKMLSITINDTPLTTEDIKLIRQEGIIYFNQYHNGELTVTYTVGIPSNVVEQSLATITTNLIQTDEGRNITKIKEGDLDITYNNNSDDTINKVITNLQSMRGARIGFI